MPSKKNTYKIDGKKYKDWPTAVAYAVDLSLQQQTDVTIVEHNPNSGATFYIGITAKSEEA
jgi:hypothetical protein